jgi:hypothetical protein
MKDSENPGALRGVRVEAGLRDICARSVDIQGD